MSGQKEVTAGIVVAKTLSPIAKIAVGAFDVDSPAYTLFLAGINNPTTQDGYVQGLDYCMRRLRLAKYGDLLAGDNETIQKRLTLFVAELKAAKKSQSLITNRIAILKLFYDMNSKMLNWRPIRKAIPKTPKRKDRSWTMDEIRAMYDAADIRTKAVISLLLSSGMRVGGLNWPSSEDKMHHYLLWRDLERLDKYSFYKVTVYAGEPEEYNTYTTPEAAHDLDNYKAMRERAGEVITPESPVFRNDFNIGIEESVKAVRPLFTSAIFRSLVTVQQLAGLRDLVPASDQASRGTIRHEVKAVHGFRKTFETRLLDAGMRELWVDMLEGHTVAGENGGSGLRGNYYRPQDDGFILTGNIRSDGIRQLGYLDCIEVLTINSTKLLAIENQKLKQENHVISSMKAELRAELKAELQEETKRSQEALIKMIGAGALRLSTRELATAIHRNAKVALP